MSKHRGKELTRFQGRPGRSAASVTRVSGDPVTLGADGSILINTALLPPPEKIYDADVAWVRRGRGYVSFFFGKANIDDLSRLRTRLEIKYPPEGFVRHFLRNSREFHESLRTEVKNWPEEGLLSPLNGPDMQAEKDHSDWANFDYMARAGSQGTIDFFTLPVAGLVRFTQGHGSSGLIAVPVVRVQLSVLELSSLLDASQALADEVRRQVPVAWLKDKDDQ